MTDNFTPNIDDFTTFNGNKIFLICELLGIEMRTCKALNIDICLEHNTIQISTTYTLPNYAAAKIMNEKHNK
jgi:hypothetical protein